MPAVPVAATAAAATPAVADVDVEPRSPTAPSPPAAPSAGGVRAGVGEPVTMRPAYAADGSGRPAFMTASQLATGASAVRRNLVIASFHLLAYARRSTPFSASKITVLEIF